MMEYSEQCCAVLKPAISESDVFLSAALVVQIAQTPERRWGANFHAFGSSNLAVQIDPQLATNWILTVNLGSHLPFVFDEIRSYQCYQNEYQTALDRNLPEVTATHGFLEKPQKNTTKTGQKCPIPTLASISFSLY